MVLDYEVTTDDFVKFSLYHYKNSPTYQRQILMGRLLNAFVFVAVVMGIGLAISPLLDLGWGIALVAWGVPAVLGAIAAFLVFPRLSDQKLRKLLPKLMDEGKNDGVTGKQCINVTPEAIINRPSIGDHRVPWMSVERLVQTSDHVLIYVGSMSAAIIRLNFFATDEDLLAFIETIKRYYGAATGKSLPTVVA
ncbi:MAG: YcxB family protein [SAR202 cluster bacterium]|nr:YcxB family protein [SAR202 cluster bacterium]